MVLLFSVRVHAKVGSGLEIETGKINYSLAEVIKLGNEKITDSFCYSQGLRGFIQLEIRKLCKEFY